MILFTAQESSALPTLAETQAVAVEVHEDFTAVTAKRYFGIHQNMDSRPFIHGLPVICGRPHCLYRLTYCYLHKPFSEKTFDRMGMDLSLSKFLISLANAITYAIVIFMALEKDRCPIRFYHRSFRFRNFGYWPFPSGKSCKLCRRYPDPYYAAFRYS